MDIRPNPFSGLIVPSVEGAEVGASENEQRLHLFFTSFNGCFSDDINPRNHFPFHRCNDLQNRKTKLQLLNVVLHGILSWFGHNEYCRR